MRTILQNSLDQQVVNIHIACMVSNLLSNIYSEQVNTEIAIKGTHLSIIFQTKIYHFALELKRSVPRPLLLVETIEE